MTQIYDLQQRADVLRKKTATDSISPEEVGRLHADTLAYIANMERYASSLGIKKVYTSVSEMNGDESPVSSTGMPLKAGQLVTIFNAEAPDAENSGEIYAFQNPGWVLVGRLDAGTADTLKKLIEGDKATVSNNNRNAFVWLGNFETWVEAQTEIDKLHATGEDNTKVGEFRLLLNGRNLIVHNYVQSWETGIFTQTIQGSILWNAETQTMDQSLNIKTYERQYNGTEWTIWEEVTAKIELAQELSTDEGSENKAISQKAVSQITSALIEPIKCDAVKYIADKYVRTATLEDCVGNKLAVFEVKKGNTYIIRGFNTPIAKSIGANTGLYSYYRDIDLTDNISYIGAYASQGTNSYIRKCIFRPTEDGYIALNNVSDIRDDYVWLYRLTNSIVDNLSIDKFDEEILKSDRYRKIEKSETVDGVDYYELTIDKVYLARINRTILTGTYGKSFLAWYTDTTQTNRVGIVTLNTADKAELYVDILINPYSGSYLNHCAYLKKIDTEIELYEVLNYEDYLKTNVIICEGDSLTAGLAGDGHSYPAKLLELIRSNYPKYKYAVFNGGLTGASAQTIAMMAGAMSYELSNDVEIAANSYSADENFVDLLGKSTISVPKGQENYVSLFNDKFNKLTVNTVVTKIYNDSDTPVTCNAGEKLYLRRIKSRYNLYLPPKVICIYLGRNDKYSDVDSAISHMINCTKKIIERYNATNYVVISQFDFWNIFNDDEKMSKYEKAFDSEFNKHYINFRWYARNKWFTYSELEPTEDDESAMQLGRAPKSIYASGDLIHLSATGYDFLGELVYKKLIELNILPIKVK